MSIVSFLAQNFGKITSRNVNNKNYKLYSEIIEDFSTKINKTSCTKIELAKTPKKIIPIDGYNRETLETLQSVEFMEKYYKLLKSKGYKMPSKLGFSETAIPENCGILGTTFGRQIVYNPKCMPTMDFRIPVHELGHRLSFQVKYPIIDLPGNIVEMGLNIINSIAKKIPFLRKKMGNKNICHLSFKEQEILEKDYDRAFKEGFFKYNPIEEVIRRNKQPGMNKITKDFRRNPGKYYLPNSQLNRLEFIADYFNLAARGFKFSPEIERKYKFYLGPEIKELITKTDMKEMAKLKKELSKKTLSDYGYFFNKET